MKVLFWFPTDFTYFFNAYYFSKKYESKFFAIVDAPQKMSNFYKKQNFITFSKVWYLREEINKDENKLDLDYLRRIENEYDLNIWKLALNERYFYKFFSFHEFSRDEILLIEQNLCKLFDSIINEHKPDVVITKEPGLHHLELFIHMCKNKNIRVFQLKIPNIGKKLLISQSQTSFDIKSITSLIDEDVTFNDLNKFYHTNKFSENINRSVLQVNPTMTDKITVLFSYLLSKPDLKNDFTYFGKTKIKTLKFIFEQNLRKLIRESFMNKNLSHNLPNSKFIYYPMGVDMDANQLIRNPILNNQIEFIRILAKSIPVDFVLVVKEHPAQIGRYWRSITEIKEILRIPNVIYMHHTFPQDELYKKTSLVITSSGSAGLESLFFGKPSIILNETLYSVIPAVTRISDLNHLNYQIKNALKKSVNPSDVKKFLHLLNLNSVDFDLLEFGKKFQSEFMYKDLILNTEIDHARMDNFISEHEELFDPLVSALVSRIDKSE